jgi:hypothetical protein
MWETPSSEIASVGSSWHPERGCNYRMAMLGLILMNTPYVSKACVLQKLSSRNSHCSGASHAQPNAPESNLLGSALTLQLVRRETGKE